MAIRGFTGWEGHKTGADYANAPGSSSTRGVHSNVSGTPSPTVSTDNVFGAGKTSLKVEVTTTNVNSIYWGNTTLGISTATSGETLAFFIRVFPDLLPAANGAIRRIVRFQQWNNWDIYAEMGSPYDTTATIKATSLSGTVTLGTITQGEAFTLCGYIQLNGASPSTSCFQLNSETPVTTLTGDSSRAFSTNVMHLGVIAATGSATSRWYFDDLVWGNATTDYDLFAANPTMTVVGGLCTSDGTHGSWSADTDFTDEAAGAYTQASTNIYAKLNQSPKDAGDTTYMLQNVNEGAFIALKYSGLSSAIGTVHAVAAHLCFSASAAVTRTVKQWIHDGTNTVVGAVVPQVTGTTNAIGSNVFTTNPAGGAWTTGGLTTLQIRHSGGNGVGGIRMYGSYAEALYTPGAAMEPSPPGRSSPSSPSSGKSNQSNPKKKGQGGSPATPPVTRTASLLFSLRRSRHWDIIP